MGNAIDVLERGLCEGLADLRADEQLIGLLADRDDDAILEAGRRAVRLATAPLLWTARVGPVAPTAEVAAALGISRQAVAKAVHAGRLISLPAGKTRLFPLWQLRLGPEPTIRPEVASIVAAFVSGYPEVAGHVIASWATSPQPELDDKTPAQWLETGQPLGAVLVAARRAASALAQ
ncbi:MAG: hypothetical protein ACRD0J_14405 [Acidimicrobiales bacterium]